MMITKEKHMPGMTQQSLAERALNTVAANRVFVALIASCLIGSLYYCGHPFPADNPYLQVIARRSSDVYNSFYALYVAVVYGLPLMGVLFLLSQLYVRAVEGGESITYKPLPEYPDPTKRESLFVIVGETHNRYDFERAVEPSWCVIPEKGLYTGILVLGAIGSGKTSTALTPFIDQLVAYKATIEKDEHGAPLIDAYGNHVENKEKLSGLVLEVKGDFCHTVRDLLVKYDRNDDYFEIGVDSDFAYNPLYNDMSANARAYQIASVMNQLFGKGGDPYWILQGTKVIKMIITLYEVADDYVTFINILRAASNDDVLKQKLESTRRNIGMHSYFTLTLDQRSLHDAAFQAEGIEWEAVDGDTKHFRAPASHPLKDLLRKLGLPVLPQCYKIPQSSDRDKQAMLEEVGVWAQEWFGYKPELRKTIVSSVSAVLSMFTDNPNIARMFCPPKEVYQTDGVNKTFAYGKPMPRFAELIEQGKVCAVNFPVALDAALSKFLGTCIKADFQRSMINRIPKMRGREHEFRAVFFAVDECQYFVTCGGSDPSGGDEYFLSLSRQPKCIPIYATQSVSSLKTAINQGEAYKTLLQVFRTTMFFATKDDETANEMARNVGKADRIKKTVSLSESTQDANVSLLTGRTVGDKSSVTQSINYSSHLEDIFLAHRLYQLENAVTISLIFDGRQAKPQVVYTCPHYLPLDITWHEKAAAGML